jgi:hypothetical protein
LTTQSAVFDHSMGDKASVPLEKEGIKYIGLK